MCSTGRMWDVIFQCMASESHGITSLTPHHWHSCPPPRAKIPPLAHQNPLERCCSYASHSSGHIVCHKKDALSQVYPPMAQRYPQAFCILCTSYLKSDVKCGHSLCDPVVSCVTNICLDSIWIHMSNGLNLLHPRKDVAEMVIVFCVSPIVPEGLVFVDMKWASDWKNRSRSSRTSSSRRTSSSSRRKSSSSSSSNNENE